MQYQASAGNIFPPIDTMLIRRLPQPSLGRKCLTFIFGHKIVPAIETVNVVADNMRYGYNMQHNPHVFDRVSQTSKQTCPSNNMSTHCYSCIPHQMHHLYQVRYLSEYQKALKQGLIPEKKPIPEFKVQLGMDGMVYPGQRVTWTQ